MKEKEKKKKVKLIIALAIALVVMIGGTYAWLTLTKQGTKVNVIKAGTFELTLDDEASEGILITGEAAQPIPTSEGVTLEGYNFTVKNTGDLKAEYTLYLDDVTSVGDEEITNRMADKYVRYSLNYTENNETALLTTIGSNPNRILYQGTLESGASKTFNLKLWIDQDADNNVLGTTFAGQIRLEAEQARKATKLCKRATTLHTETCSQTDSSSYCSADGYASGDTITYGSLGTSGTLASGDAFDCDVNGDGTYDATTERFYYVSDMTNGVTTDSNTAVLIYYNNVSGGVASNSTAYAYDSSGSNNNGPVTALAQLPTTSQWKNVSLTNTTRAITNESGGTTTLEGNLPTAFSYSGYAARLLTYQEVYNGCYVGASSKPILSSSDIDLSPKCKYLMENTKYSSTTSTSATIGGWLETPPSLDPVNAYVVNSYDGAVVLHTASGSVEHGVRPAIEVLKSNISY